MQLPFSHAQFLAVFADYNSLFLPAVVALWLAGVVSVLLAWRHRGHSRVLWWYLGLLWLWNAVAYHAWLFTRINPAAWLFAAVFAIQGLLFWRAAIRARVEFFTGAGRVGHLATALIVYAFVYPFFAAAFDHEYPATPTFGLPCPTAILSIGLVLTLRGPIPLRFAIIPLFWSIVGGSAAFLLSVRADYALPVAGLILSFVATRRWLGTP